MDSSHVRRVGPLPQVLERGLARGILDPIKIGATVTDGARGHQGVPSQHASSDAVMRRIQVLMDPVTDVHYQTVQGAKGRQLKTLLNEMLHRQIDQIRGITHGRGGLLHGGFDHVFPTVLIGLDVQVGPDELAIAVQRLFRFDVDRTSAVRGGAAGTDTCEFALAHQPVQGDTPDAADT